MKRIAILLIVVLAACATPPVGEGTITGRLMAGPTCPVETNPPDPQCAPRPVVGAIVTARGDGFQRMASSDADGHFLLKTPPGEVTLEFQTMMGLMGTPGDMAVRVVAGETVVVGTVMYDTGIR